MSLNNKKIIVLKKDVLKDEIIGEKRFIKFLDKDKNYAIFYNPLIAPKYFSNFIKENGIYEAYELTDDLLLEKYKDVIYTFQKKDGVYEVSEGFEIEKKLLFLVDKGLEVDLGLEKYSYKLVGDSYYVKPLIKESDKNYCYVIEESGINPLLLDIMIDAYEVIPGVLRTKPYNLSCHIKTKKYKSKNNKQ